MLLIFVTLTLAYVAATFVSVDAIQSQIADTIGLYSVQATKATLANIYHRIGEKTDDLEILSHSYYVVDAAKESGNEFDRREDLGKYIAGVDADWQAGKSTELVDEILANDLSSYLRTYQSYFKTKDGQYAFSEIFVTDKHGLVMGATGRTSDYYQADEEWYVSAISDYDAWIGQPEYDESSKTFSIDIAKDIRNENGELIGVIKGVLNLDYVKEDLVRLQQNIPYQNIPYLVDDEGYSILSVDTTSLSSMTIDTKLKEFGTNISHLTPVRQAQASGSGFLVWDDGDSEKLTTYATLEKTKYPEKLGWILLLDFDKKEVLAPLTNLQNTVVIVGLAISGIFAVIGFMFARSISNPVESLSLAASNMSKGELEQQISVRSKDELGRLCESFNTMVKDVKRKIELEKELVRAQERVKTEKLIVIGELSSRIAHDLRNPLTTIRNACELLSMSLGDGDSKPKRYVLLIQRSLNRMSHQVEDVLDYLRTSPLNKNVNSCLEAIEAVVDLSNVPENVTVITPQNDLHISFDVRKIEIVFINLLKNAVQAIGKRQGAITISISQEGGFGVVEFEDSAGALSEVNLTRIFDPLFTTKQEGTGLGLSSCKNIVEQHGGKIQVLLNPTRFRVCLPMNQV